MCNEKECVFAVDGNLIAVSITKSWEGLRGSCLLLIYY